MNNGRFQKRISEMITDIYPLDRMLPLETVYSIFAKEYVQIEHKSTFFRNKKFQRLREGYFALFVALSLQDTLRRPHYLMFPSDPSNDVYVLYVQNKSRAKVTGCKFDIKEFTKFSDSFADFVKKKIVPKIDIYNLIIATYRKIDEKDLQCLIDCLKNKNVEIKVWLVGSPTEENDDKDISRVTIVDKDNILYDKTINVNYWLDEDKPVIIYQDVIKLK